MHLVDSGKTALHQGKTDQAISMFEQAINVDVYNGDAFFGLAQAWRRKGSNSKALEFSRKAEIIFQDDRPKLKQVLSFQEGVYRDMGDSGKADACRRKADKL